MKFFLSLIITCTAAAVFAQTKPAPVQQLFYFKNNGQQVAVADSSDFVRVVRPPDSASTLFNVSEYYRNGKAKLLGKSITINPVTFDGQCVTFFATGKRQMVLNYDQGAITGTNYMYHPNGKLYLAFEMDTVKSRSFDENMRVLSCNDTTGKALVTDGNGHYVGYDEATRAISEEGDIKAGKRTGEWHGSYPSEKVTYTDTYQNGKFISGVTTAATGAKYTYTSRQTPPEFPGGNAAFLTLVKKKVKLPAALKNKASQIFLSFTVRKNGTLTDPLLLGNISPEVNQQIIAAVNSSPAWKPKIINGLPIDASWGLPVTFGTAPVAAANKGKGKTGK